MKANAGGTNFGQITPDVNHGTIKFMTKPPGSSDNGENLTISQDLIEAKCSPAQATTVSYMKLQPVDGGQDLISFNDDGQDIDFRILSDNQTAFKLDAATDMMAFRDYVGIGYSGEKWPTNNGNLAGTPTYQLRVAGQTFLSGITTPLEVVGNISGTTGLYIDGNMFSGSTNLLDIFAYSSVTNQNVYWSASSVDESFIVNNGTNPNAANTNKVGIGTLIPNHTLSISGTVSASSNTHIQGDLGISGDTHIQSNLGITGNTYFADSTGVEIGRLHFGDSNDLTIYHDGSNSYIHDSGQGRLNIKGGAGVNIISPADENMATFEGNGAVNLYYNNNLKFATTNTGISVTGDTVVNGTLSATTSVLVGNGDGSISGDTIKAATLIAIPDEAKLKFGNAGDLEIYHNGSNSFIDDAGTGTLFYRSGTQTFQNAAGSKTMATFNAASTVDLSFNNNVKFSTNTNGVHITGTLSANTALIAGTGDGSVSASTIQAPNFNSEFLRFFSGSADGSTFIGYQAGLNGSESDNYSTAVGWRALYSIDGTPAGNYTQAFGYEAAYSQNSGSHNTAIGFRALYSNQSTTQQIAIGGGAMKNHTSGNKNTVVGYAAATFMSGSSSAENVVLGHTALAASNEGGSGSGVIRRNVIIGYEAATQTDSGSQGNVIIGHEAAASGIFTGDYNVIIGKEAGSITTSSQSNVLIGYQAGDNVTTADRVICIGKGADPASATDNYQLNIGDILYGRDAYSNTAIEEFGINRISPVTALDVIHKNINSIADDTGGGEIVTFGANPGGVTAGKLYYLNSSGVWTLTQANASSNNGNSQLLAIALGSAVSDGMLLRGFFDMASYFTGTFGDGKPVYVCETTAGNVNIAQHAANNEFVRVVGYCCDVGKVIYFNPDATYITVEA